jgi:hypothetical protein
MVVFVGLNPWRPHEEVIDVYVDGEAINLYHHWALVAINISGRSVGVRFERVLPSPGEALELRFSSVVDVTLTADRSSDSNLTQSDYEEAFSTFHYAILDEDGKYGTFNVYFSDLVFRVVAGKVQLLRL